MNTLNSKHCELQKTETNNIDYHSFTELNESVYARITVENITIYFQSKCCIVQDGYFLQIRFERNEAPRVSASEYHLQLSLMVCNLIE